MNFPYCNEDVGRSFLEWRCYGRDFGNEDIADAADESGLDGFMDESPIFGNEDVTDEALNEDVGTRALAAIAWTLFAFFPRHG